MPLKNLVIPTGAKRSGGALRFPLVEEIRAKAQRLLHADKNLGRKNTVIHRFEAHSYKIVITVLLFICASLLTACNQSHSAKTTAATEAQPAARRYALTGRVVSVDKPNQSINIDGNEIPGFMGAMQMPYPVKDATLLDKVAPGNQIKAEIVMGNDGAYLENIIVVNSPPAKPSK
jgi:Cu/Ag efflux protein CusF